MILVPTLALGKQLGSDSATSKSGLNHSDSGSLKISRPSLALVPALRPWFYKYNLDFRY